MGIKQFSEQVKVVRAALNLSQEELAHSLGISFATVNRWENSKTTPSKMAQGGNDCFGYFLKVDRQIHEPMPADPAENNIDHLII